MPHDHHDHYDGHCGHEHDDDDHLKVEVSLLLSSPCDGLC